MMMTDAEHFFSVFVLSTRP